MNLEVNIEKKLGDFPCQFRFTINEKKCGIFGASGCGKSTLMHLLAGLLTPDKGWIKLNGQTLFDSQKGINLAPEDRRIGVVFQHAHLFPHMSVEKNLFYGMNRTPTKGRDIDQQTLFQILQIEPLLNRRVSKLSGGERQRVALGRTILACPQLILLDEPLAGLDNTLKYQIIPHLQRVFSEFSIPIIFISHSLQEMRMMTKKVLVMGKGYIEKQISSEDLARSRLGSGGQGYINLLNLDRPKDLGNLLSYHWGDVELMLSKNNTISAKEFTLNSHDILLFKKHPEATSARNMLACTVRKTYQTDWLIGVELDCQGNTLIAEIVPQSLQELSIKVGSKLVAVFKASAIQSLY